MSRLCDAGRRGELLQHGWARWHHTDAAATFDMGAISLAAPVALVCVVEHIGQLLAVGMECGGIAIPLGNYTLPGMPTATLVGILLNLILPGRGKSSSKES